jgi:hypothetical protein
MVNVMRLTLALIGLAFLVLLAVELYAGRKAWQEVEKPEELRKFVWHSTEYGLLPWYRGE